MKKLILLAALYCLLPGLYAASVKPSTNNFTAPVDASERAKAHFKANYGNAADASWYKLDDKNNMYCIFHQGKRIEKVFYNNRGNWQYTLISYPSSEMDENVKVQVLNTFDGYHITYVNEVRSVYKVPVYIVNIENDSFIKILKVVGDEIELQQSLIKG